jgi:glycosyltransferase involved in cell wall biosynthesis
MRNSSDKALYLCYFGLREPLVQTQVLPYLREIQKGGTKISLLTFEPDPGANWTAGQIADEKRRLAGEGVEWDFLTYHKRPSVPATLFDILRGALYTWNRLRRERIGVLHARLHVPAVMAALARNFSFRARPRLLFDIRGFFPEEYVDAGLWKKNGLLYRTVKRAERWLIRESDAFVVLTEKARNILFPESAHGGVDKAGRPVEVIPCCVDPRRFVDCDCDARKAVRLELGADDRFVIAYVGSFGGWYLTEEMADFFGTARRRDERMFAMILTQSRPDEVAAGLRKRGLAERDYFIGRVEPADVPRFLSAADAAVSFIKPCYSKLSSSPTKIAEYLMSGTPVIANSGVGDVAELLGGAGCGIVLAGFDERSYGAALDGLEALRRGGDLRERCRAAARSGFDLEKTGGERYRRIYRTLLGK